MKNRLQVLTPLLSVLSFFVAKGQPSGIDLQGHRGARGLMPENTVPAFITALDLGVTTLELDVVISKDREVVVSHDPYFSASICKDSVGNEIDRKVERVLNIYTMTLQEIQKFDCGSRLVKRFPLQAKMEVYKPSLREVIVASENHIKGVTGYLINYNIEIKSSPSGDGIYHPRPEEFSDLVYQEIDKYLPWDRINIQSFDFRILQYWHEKYPTVTLAALIENNKSVEENLEHLGFSPEIYSPYYLTLTKSRINKIHNLGMKVIPWTINDTSKMRKFRELGVDGIITDYPDSARTLGYTIPVPYKK